MSYPNHLSTRERLIIDAAVRDILAAGYMIAVFCDLELDCPRTTDYEAITNEIGTCSQTELTFYGPDRKKAGWVMFVHGNDCDVLADHTANPVTEKLLARAIRIAEGMQE